MNVTRWLRGHADVSPHGKGYVRLWFERPGVTAEVYLTLSQARELRDSLIHILRPSGGGHA